MGTTIDRYDQEVERLTKKLRTDELAIEKSWGDAEPLFEFCTRDRSTGSRGKICGCLVMIRNQQKYVAETVELTASIRADKQLPVVSSSITVEHLPIFAEWQRRIDKELGRTPPPLLPTGGHILAPADIEAAPVVGSERV